MLETDELIDLAMQVRGTAARENEPMMAMLYAISGSQKNVMMPWTDSTLELRMACLMLRLSDPTFTEVAYISDAYGVTLPKTDENIDRVQIPRGSLEKRFKAGDPDVYETLNICVVRRDGTNTMIQIRYDMVEGVPVYGDPAVSDGDYGLAGTVPDALRVLFA